MDTGQCHPKTIRSQYHHSQALQLTVWKKQKIIQALQYNSITVSENEFCVTSVTVTVFRKQKNLMSLTRPRDILNMVKNILFQRNNCRKQQLFAVFLLNLHRKIKET